MTDTPNEPGWLILVGFIAFIAGPQFLAVAQESGPAHFVVTGVYILGIGTFFLLAYYFEHKSVLFRGLMWLCEKGSFPASRKMAFFYASLAAVLGTMAILQGLGFINVSRHG